jgi:hypothetical protein
MQGRLTTRPRDSLARSVDQWLVVKVGDGPRFVATAARPDRASPPEHITGRAKRTPARGAGTLARVVPVGRFGLREEVQLAGRCDAAGSRTCVLPAPTVTHVPTAQLDQRLDRLDPPRSACSRNLDRLYPETIAYVPLRHKVPGGA